MNLGFFIILGSQFLSALADNALFFAAMALLKQQAAPEWHTSMLLWFFTVSYVVLAPFAGSFADSMHKGRAMMICNGIKFAGCVGMLAGVPPLLAYGVVGFGAAAYSPAKYGIITEYLPHEKLVAANGWLEGATVAAIIFGAVFGATFSDGEMAPWLNAHLWGISPAAFAISMIILLYLAAAWLNLYIPKLDVRLKPMHKEPWFLVKEFWWCVKRLWRDPAGQISMAVTTLFWGAGQTIRLVVINWAILSLHYSPKEAASLSAISAVGVAIGSIVAGRYIPLRRAFSVLPAGIAMGLLVTLMLVTHTAEGAMVLMLIIGCMAGFFVVPLNAMLQHRGHRLMGAGHSIAVQNFNEHLGILLMVGCHALLVKYLSTPFAGPISAEAAEFFTDGKRPPMEMITVGFGLFVATIMTLLLLRCRRWVKNGILTEGEGHLCPDSPRHHPNTIQAKQSATETDAQGDERASEAMPADLSRQPEKPD